MDDFIEVSLRMGAIELQSLDDDRVLRELGMTHVRHLGNGARYRMTVADAKRLLDTFRSNHGAGWVNDNPGSVASAARGAQRAIEKALASRGLR